MRKSLPFVLACALGSCSFEAPLSDRFADSPPPGTITGVIVANDLTEEPTETIIAVTPFDEQLPPDGTSLSNNLTYTVIGGDEFTRYADDDTRYGANYYLPTVYEGDWAMVGLMDRDGDFSVVDTVLASWSCGDILGGYRNDSGELNRISVTGGDRTEGIPVELNNPVVFERPSFVMEPGSLDGTPLNGVNLRPEAINQSRQSLILQATAIHASSTTGNLELDLDYSGSGGTCQAGFEALLIDEDLSGSVDSSSLVPLGGFVNAYPLIAATYIGVPQEDGSFVEDGVEEGATYQTLFLPHPDALPAPVGGGTAPLNQSFYTDRMEFLWSAAVQKTSANGESTLLLDPTTFPKGAWNLLVLNPNGSNWAIPNSLGTSAWAPKESSETWDPVRQLEFIVLEN